MVLPFIPLVLIGGGVVSGTAGVINGALGAGKMKEARGIAGRAAVDYDEELKRTQAATGATNHRVKAYGRKQEASRRQVVGRMAEFIRRHQRQVSESAALLLDGVEVPTGTLGPFDDELLGDAVDWVAGVLKAGTTGATVYIGVPAAVSATATASTGTAIASLSGAAAESATAAWLGGGSLASGGGGMALGATALNFATIGPTLLVTGLVLSGQGEKALTRARKYEADVAIARRNQRAFRVILASIDERIWELSRLLKTLSTRAVRALEDLESESFDAERHTERFQKAMELALAVRDVASTPVIDKAGDLDARTESLIIKYRGIA